MGSISAADANRNFSALLRRVQDGEVVTITSRGRPVAEIRPPDAARERRKEALGRLLHRLRNQPFVDVGPWTREELYERDPKPGGLEAA